MSQEGKLFSLPIRVYFQDTDAGGVAYHASYLNFMERARTEWLRTHGYSNNFLSITSRPCTSTSSIVSAASATSRVASPCARTSA